MACAGIDFGNKGSVVAIARRGGIDICTNEVSNRSTPSMVSFQGDERHVGEAAASIAAQNHRNTVGGLQRLLGLTHSNPFAKEESSRSTCPIIAHPTTGTTAVAVDYTAVDPDDVENSKTIFSLEAVAAMFFSNLMMTASNEYKAPVHDLVISVPVYYTDAQRRAVLNAAKISNINVIRIMNEHAAIALSYGIFRTKELPETDPIKVAFVDIGEASTSVSITAFTSSKCDVLSVASDPCLGGRDLDDILFNKFANDFKDTYKIDVRSKPKPSARLRKECEKIKKILSTNPQGLLNMECLMDDVDVRGQITRDELMEVAEPLLGKIRAVCEKAIRGAKLASGEKLTAVEIVGGSTRVPAFKATIADVFSPLCPSLSTTLNADECIARGCALMCAMLSPAFKVRDYTVNDIAADELVVDKVFTDGSPTESLTIVPKGNPVPCVKVMKFRSPGPLTINVRYKDTASLPGAVDHPQVCSYLVGAPSEPEAKVHAKVRMSGSGIVELAAAQIVREVEEEEEVVVKQSVVEPAVASEPEKSAEANGAMDGDASMKEPVPDSGKVENISGQSEGVAEEPSKMDMDDIGKGAKVPEPSGGNPGASQPVAPVVTEKRLVKKKKTTDLLVTPLPDVCTGLTDSLVIAATEKEGKMKAHDLYIRERSEAMNGLEAYVYDMRSRLDEYGGDLKDFSTSDTRSSLRKSLDETEEWIYSEEAENASKSDFVKRKESLADMANDMLWRKREFEERPVRISVLEAAMENYKKVLSPGAEEYAHVTDEEKNKVQKSVESAAIWLKESQQKQSTLRKDQNPALTCAALNARLNEVDAVCDPIQKKPKPAPPKAVEPEKKAAEAENESGKQKEDVKMDGDSKDELKKPGDEVTNGEKMGVEKDVATEEMKD